MSVNKLPFGFRIAGASYQPRMLVDPAKAFGAYADCDDRAIPDNEGFLSAFQFDEELASRSTDQVGTLDTRNYEGIVYSTFLWFDIDRPNQLDLAHDAALILILFILDRYQLDKEDLLVFFSGSKGFHIGVPTSVFDAEPSLKFHRVARELAETLARHCDVVIDTAIYGIVQPLRAPNSRHGRTGLFKRIVTVDELVKLKAKAIRARAESPEPFEWSEECGVHDQAIDDWQTASEQVRQRELVVPSNNDNRVWLNERTTAFLRKGCEPGERNNRLFSASANLGEFGCNLRLARALLWDASMEIGISKREFNRTVEKGIRHGGGS